MSTGTVTVEQTLDAHDLNELGSQAVWSLSTAKPGNGIDNLRDDNTSTFWQSDGVQPHIINIQFLKKVDVCMVAFYLDYTADESYTPKKMTIRAGSCLHDLIDIAAVDMSDPTGWVTVDLRSYEKEGEAAVVITALRCHFLQIKIVSMHQNGRDTHMRQVKIFGQRKDSSRFLTEDMSQFDCIR